MFLSLFLLFLFPSFFSLCPTVQCLCNKSLFLLPCFPPLPSRFPFPLFPCLFLFLFLLSLNLVPCLGVRNFSSMALCWPCATVAMTTYWARPCVAARRSCCGVAFTALCCFLAVALPLWCGPLQVLLRCLFYLLFCIHCLILGWFCVFSVRGSRDSHAGCLSATGAALYTVHRPGEGRMSYASKTGVDSMNIIALAVD